MQAEADVLEVGDLAGGVGDLVLCALVLEFEEAAVRVLACGILFSSEGREKGGTHRLGSILFPSALFFNFFRVAGPTFERWSALGEVMMESQMTALLVGAASGESASGHSAVT